MKCVTLVLVLCMSLFAACSRSERPPRSDEGRPIKMLTVGAASSATEREYLGTISAAQEVRLGFEVPGQIVEFAVTAGQRVDLGDLLAKLEETNFVATRDAAAAQVEAAEADAKRKRGLVEIGGVSRVALEEAERRFTAATSDLSTAEKALRDTQLRAPFSGVIAQTIAENFSNVRAKQAILTLQDPAWMEIEVNVPEADAAGALPGLTLAERNERISAVVVVSALPGREFPASVTEFSTTADPVTRTYALTLVFETPQDVMVLAGMTAHVQLSTASAGGDARGYRLPVQVVAGDESKAPFVWIIGGDMKATKRTVEVGELAGSMIQIVAGVEAGDRVALTGVHLLREGLSVREWAVE